MRSANTESGFTLIEVIMTLAIGGIVLGMGVPSFASFIKSNRMTNQVNDFISTANIARSEAVKRGLRVHVCKSYNGVFCDTGASSWDKGWIAFVDTDEDGLAEPGETLVSVVREMTDGTTLRGDPNITDSFYFTPKGTTNFSERSSLTSYGELIFCGSEKDTSKARAVSITAVGRMETIKASDSGMSCI